MKKLTNSIVLALLLASANGFGVASQQDALAKAIQDNSAAEVNSAFQGGASASAEINGHSLLEYALLLKKPDAANALITNKVEVTVDDILLALKMHEVQVAALILNQVKLQEADMLNVLGEAALAYGNISVRSPSDDKSLSSLYKIFEKLLDLGLSANLIWSENPSMNSGLIAESFFINQKPLALFLKRGANPNYGINRWAATWIPLFLAIRIPSIPTLKVLLDAGADINLGARPKSTKELYTALGFAMASRRSHDMISFLVQRGASMKADKEVSKTGSLSCDIVQKLKDEIDHIFAESLSAIDPDKRAQECSSNLRDAASEVIKSVKDMLKTDKK